MKQVDKVHELVNEYKEKYSLFEEYTKTIYFLIENILRKYSIQFQAVQFRTKEVLKFNKKLLKKEYLQKRKLVEMPDLSGCRVLFYLEDKIDEFVRILYDEFKVVKDEVKVSLDEYNARHIIIKLKENRLNLPEYSKFKELQCEIQLTTTLYHTWSEIQHDIIYKPNELLLEFDKPTFDYLEGYFKEIMEEHLKKASIGFSFIFNEFKKIQLGQTLINPKTIDVASKSTSNNDIYNFLKLLNEYVAKYANKLPKGYKLIDALELTLNSAKKNPIVDQETIFGKLKGSTYIDIANEVLNILDSLRYYDIPNRLSLIIHLAKEKELQSKCENILKRTVAYNIEMINRYGFYVQKVVLGYVSELKSEYILENLDIILTLIAPIAPLECEDLSMSSYDKLVFKRGCLPPSVVLQKIRARYFELMKSFLELVNIDTDRKKVLRTMFFLANTPHFELISEDIITLLSSDIVKITDYLSSYYDSASNFIKKEIQQFVFGLERLHFKDRFVNLIKLKEKLDYDTIFARFRIFYGNDIDFFSNFDFKAAQEFRTKKIEEFVQEIQEENFEEWLSLFKELVASYTSSDLGSFMYFNMFLRKIAKEKPAIASKLLNIEAFSPFLNHILGGLLNSPEQQQAKELIVKYSKDRTKQLATIQAVLSQRDFDESIFKELYPILVESTDTTVLLTLLQVIIRSYNLHKNHKEKISDILNKFTALRFYSWSSVYYLSSDFWKEVSDENIESILENLKYCDDIGYQEESVLSSISEKKPKAVIRFFHERLELSKAKEISHPIPFEFSLIKDSLSKNAKETLHEIVKWFSKEDQLANWHASNLIRNIFPSFNSDLESSLLALVKKRDKKNLRIVLQILEKYDGQPFLHNTVKEIVKIHPMNEKLEATLFHILSDVRAIISGEYGFYDILKMKKEETKDWQNDSNAEIREFAVKYHKFLDKRIIHEKDRVDKEIAFRERKFEVARE